MEHSLLLAKTSFQKMTPFALGNNDQVSLLVEMVSSGTDVDRSVKRWLAVIQNSIVIMSCLSRDVFVHQDKLTIMASVWIQVHVLIWFVDRSLQVVRQSPLAITSTSELLTYQNNLFSSLTFSSQNKLSYWTTRNKSSSKQPVMTLRGKTLVDIVHLA